MEALKKLSLLLGFSALGLTGCDVEDVEDSTARLASDQVDAYWDESDKAFYAFPRSQMEPEALESIAEAMEPEVREVDGIEDLTTFDPTAATCCRANCTNGYCKVPGGPGVSCSCGCSDQGQPTCTQQMQ